VLCGAEVNTKEEVHCLAFFEEKDQLNDFQEYLDQNLPVVKNKPALFGDQVWVDAENNILGEEERLLIVGLLRSIDEVAEKVGSIGGIFVPAHVDRPRNSVTSQLGFMPPDLRVTALEISRVAKLNQVLEEYKWLKKYRLITNSDAHVPEDIGAGYSILLMEDLSFKEVKMALSHQKGRKIVTTSIKL
jgi:3',5'-nucleoside bisphosphate phosphatase